MTWQATPHPDTTKRVATCHAHAGEVQPIPTSNPTRKGQRVESEGSGVATQAQQTTARESRPAVPLTCRRSHPIYFAAVLTVLGEAFALLLYWAYGPDNFQAHMLLFPLACAAIYLGVEMVCPEEDAQLLVDREARDRVLEGLSFIDQFETEEAAMRHEAERG